MSFPGDIHSMILVGGNCLRIERVVQSTGLKKVATISLDQRLGNQEGSFHVGGNSFSHSARDIHLVGNILYATLATSDGVWWDDQLAIDIEISQQNADVLSINFRQCDFMRLKGSRNLRLIDGFLLAAEYLQLDFSYKETFLDLNICLGNKNGCFSKKGSSFSNSAKNTSLIGGTLYADLKPNGRDIVRSSIELTSILRFTEDGIKPLKNVDPKDSEFEVIRDKSGNPQWLPNAWNIRLLNYKRKRTWYLIADCLMPENRVRESLFKLSDIIGPHIDEMFGVPFFMHPEIPEGARYVSLENGILTASFQRVDEKIWEQRSIDLGHIVTNISGALSLKEFGSTCRGCRSLFFAGTFYTPVQGRAVELNCHDIESAARVCTFCRLLHEAITAFKPADGPHDAWIMTTPSPPKVYDRSDPRKIELIVRAYDKQQDGLRRHFRQSKNEPPTLKEMRCSIQLELQGLEASNSGMAQSTPENSGSTAAIPMRFRTMPRVAVSKCWLQPDLRWAHIKKWIEVCSTEHKGCQKIAPTELPLRYLDIGLHEKDGVKVVSSKPGERGTYACLSHCWGGKDICTLNSGTKSRYSKAIPLRVLPPVFADAIAVCRRLGLRRLWIDSLCIQQDSKQDWLQEAPKMGQYYSNCAVCIAATGSVNSTVSIEIENRPTAVRSADVDTKSGPFNFVVYPSNLLTPKQHFVQAVKEQALSSFPLVTRAWVFQERLLVPRTLHFCGSEVVFECMQRTECECGRSGKSVWDRDLTDMESINVVRATTATMDGLVIRRRPLRELAWVDLIGTYSLLNLTYNTDRLTAISGLASTLFYSRKKDQHKGESPQAIYLAGIWRDNLARELSWFVGNPLLRFYSKDKQFDMMGDYTKRRQRPAEYLAPSWSWASVLDPVQHFLEDNPKHHFDLVQAHINLETSDPFGSVAKGCYLHLQGKLLQSSLQICCDNKSGIDSFVLSDLVGTQMLDKDDVRGVTFSMDYALGPDGSQNISPGAMLFVFPLVTQNISLRIQSGMPSEMNKLRDIVKSSRSTLCLVLKASDGLPGMKDLVYERVGFAEYSNLKEGVRNIDPNDYAPQTFYII